MVFVIFLIVLALAFEYVNGFHDAANAIATSVATRTLTARQAVTMAATCDLLGALTGTAVATTIAEGLVDIDFVSRTTILCALLAAVFWNLITWWFGLPSSSSHALIGGLCGATLASAFGDWHVIKWSVVDPGGHKLGLLHKVVIPMFFSPICGAVFGFLFMGLLVRVFRHWPPARLNKVFSKAQIASSAWMSFSHGMNDAQKTMGIIALTLLIATTKSGSLNDLPSWLQFMHTPHLEIRLWVKICCATVMGAGIATGGWRIIKTMGSKLVRLQTIHGFAAQATAAGVIGIASTWGMPLSTTHVISTTIMGVGATKRLNAVKWKTMGRIVLAWVLTLPLTMTVGYSLMRFFQLVGKAH